MKSDNTEQEIDKNSIFIRGDNEDVPLVYILERRCLLSSQMTRQHFAHVTSRRSGCSLRTKPVCTRN